MASNGVKLGSRTPIRVYLLDNSFKTILADENTIAEVLWHSKGIVLPGLIFFQTVCLGVAKKLGIPPEFAVNFALYGSVDGATSAYLFALHSHLRDKCDFSRSGDWEERKHSCCDEQLCQSFVPSKVIYGEDVELRKQPTAPNAVYSGTLGISMDT
jgi:hypothetical protein